MKKSDHKVSNEQLENNGNSSLVHTGSTLSQLENLVTQVTQSHLCENEQNWNGGYAEASGFPCGSPHAKFYEWTVGTMDCEAYLCDSCAKQLAVFEDDLEMGDMA